MTCIGLVIKPAVNVAHSLAHEIIAWAESKRFDVLCEAGSASALGRGAGVSPEDLMRRADVVVSLGGDGTLVGVARHAGAHSPVLVGVKFGLLGFLTEIAPIDVVKTVEDVLANRAPVGERSLIVAEVYRDGKSVFRSQAMNDVVTMKESTSRLLDIDFAVNSKQVMRVRADGLIIATPTGSTAYSLAAGGSIVYPSLDVLLVTPVCPHSLTMRPLILDMNSELAVAVPDYDRGVNLTVDGQVSFALEVRDRIVVRRSPYRARIALSNSEDYFSILRSKLNWGMGNGAF